MKTIQKLFKELKYEVMKNVFVDIILNTVILFFVTHIILSFFGFKFWISLLIAVAYFIVTYRKRVNNFHIKTIEDKNVNVKEILRTARDNMNDNSLMATALFADLLKRMKDVSVGNVLDNKRLLVKTLTASMLSFVLILVAGITTNTVVFDVPESIRNLVGEGNIGDYEFGSSLKDDDSIYGESNLIDLGNEELELKINPRLSEMNFQEEQEIEELEFQNSFPIEDLGASAEAAYQEDFGELADLAAKYTIEIKT